MIKKHFMLLLTLVALAFATANASTWKLHNYYMNSKIQNVYDTGDKVYYLNSGRLFQFDKTTLQTIALTKQNQLSDGLISQIYYDWENRLLFVAYATSNIDVIDANGKVTNVSGIKDVEVHFRDYTYSNGIPSSYTNKMIRDITFSGGVAYVAMGFGFMTIDESTLTVTRSYDAGDGITINSVAIVGDQMVMLSNRNCFYGDPNDNDPRAHFKRKAGSYSGMKLYPIDDHSTFLFGTQNLYYFDFSAGDPSLSTLLSEGPTCVQKTSTGFVANFTGKAFYYTFDTTGKTATKVNATATTFATSNPLGDGSIWINDANGLSIKGTSTYYKINSLTTDKPYWLKYNAAMNVLYAAVSGPIALINNNATTISNVINTYDGNMWKNVSYSASGAGYALEFSPLDPTTYVRAGWTTGISKVTKDVKKVTYTNTNSLIGKYKPTPAFDNYGNMWVVTSYDNPTCPVAVLPVDKFNKSSVAKTDWFQPTGLLALNTGSMQRSRFVVSKKTNYKIFVDGDVPTSAGNGHIFCWDNGNVDPTVDTYRLSDIITFVDQNDHQVKWVYINHMEEDKQGNIWVCHTQGLFMFDPTVVFDEQPRAVRPYVTNFNEGKGYLCEGFSVYDMGVDRDDNKWLATDNGVFFVSPDASVVYNHFTTDNSDLPSDLVYSIECDTINDRVYIYTDNGFAEYVPEGDAASLSFDNVYVFPNPVEPDFTGMIKITGLMDNTYVTITDREGNIVKQAGPVMGSMLWDGSAEGGERVPTGMYNVYAAQGAQPVVDGKPLTTLMIIK